MDFELNEVQKIGMLALMEADQVVSQMTDDDLVAFIKKPQSEWSETLMELVAPYMAQN
jgi:hypothetical protein